jgi:hypothetical protein
VSSSRRRPFSQTKAEQIRLVAVGKKRPQLQISPSGFISSCSAIPLIRPRSFLTGQRTLLCVSGPPNVPRSFTDPERQSAARWTSLPASNETPATHCLSLMLEPKLIVPPSDPSSFTS